MTLRGLASNPLGCFLLFALLLVLLGLRTLALTLRGLFSYPLAWLCWHAPLWLCIAHEAWFWCAALHYSRLDHDLAKTLVRKGHFWTCFVLGMWPGIGPYMLGFGKLGFFQEFGDISWLVCSWIGHSILIYCLPGLFPVYLEVLQWEVAGYKTVLRTLRDCKMRPAFDRTRKHNMLLMIEQNHARNAARTDYLELLTQYSAIILTIKLTDDLRQKAQQQVRAEQVRPGTDGNPTNATSRENLATLRGDWEWAKRIQTNLCTFWFVLWAVVPGRVIVVTVICALSHGWQVRSANAQENLRRENARSPAVQALLKSARGA